MTTSNCCAECGKEEEEGCVASLKACKSCMLVKYCNAECQKKHWPQHKIPCKLRAAELRDEALFKDPPQKEDCPICFIPMPLLLISCVTLPPATVTSVPITDFANENEGLAKILTEQYYACCGKRICKGCIYSFCAAGNHDKCPFCNAERNINATEEERVQEILKQLEVNDANSMCVLANYYHHGNGGLQQDHAKAMDLYNRAAGLGSSEAHFHLGIIYEEGGNSKKAKICYEAAASAGHEMARGNLGVMEYDSGNMERAVKHWTIGASAGDYFAMQNLLVALKNGHVSRQSIDSTLDAYNNSCAEMRSEARDAFIQATTEM